MTNTTEQIKYYIPRTNNLPPIPLPAGEWIALELRDPESIEEDGRTGNQINQEMIRKAIELTTTDKSSVLLLYDADQITRQQIMALTYSLAGRQGSGTDKHISMMSWQKAAWINQFSSEMEREWENEDRSQVE